MNIETIASLAGIISTLILLISIFMKQAPHNLLENFNKISLEKYTYFLAFITALGWSFLSGLFLYISIENGIIQGESFMGFVISFFPFISMYIIGLVAIKNPDLIKMITIFLIISFLIILVVLLVYWEIFNSDESLDFFGYIGTSMFFTPILVVSILGQ